MAQVASADVTEASAPSGGPNIEQHTVASGEALFVGVVLEVVDSCKEVCEIDWRECGIGGCPEPLSFVTGFDPCHGKLRIEVWALAAPTAANCKRIAGSIEGGNDQKNSTMAISVTNPCVTTLIDSIGTEDGTGCTGGATTTCPNQAADDLAFVFAGHLQNCDAFGIGGCETELLDVNTAQGFRVWAAEEDGTGATTLSWTQAQSKEKSTVAFVVNAAAVAAAGTNYDMRSYPRGYLRGVMRGVIGLLNSIFIGFRWRKNVNTA